MPDESWKGSGTCIHTYKSGDKLHEAWEEGSQLKEYPYKLRRHRQIPRRQWRRHLFLRAT